MPSLNNIYRAVFNVSLQGYHPDHRFYTIVLYTDDLYAGFSDHLEQNLALRLNSDTYTAIPVQQDDMIAAKKAMEQAHGVHSDHYFESSFNYVIIGTLNSAPQQLEKIQRMFDWAVELRNPGDHIFTIMTLLSNDNTNDALLNIPSVIFEKSETYLYTLSPEASDFKRRTLLDSITGVVTLNSFTNQYKEHTYRRSAAVNIADNYRFMLPPEAAPRFAHSDRMCWSSLYCKYFDHKMDFLAWYCRNMCNHIKELSDSVIITAMDQLYEQYVRPQHRNETEDLLLRTVQMIPRVEPPKKSKNVDYSLRDYFDNRHGSNGYKTVDLSLKATLNELSSSDSPLPMGVCAIKLYEECQKYKTDDLNGDIRRVLTKYIERILEQLKTNENALKKILDRNCAEDDTPLDTVRSYIQKYIELYENHNQIRFWDDMRFYLTSNHDEIDKICEESAQVTRDIASLISYCETLMVAPELSEPITFEDYTVEELYAFLDGQKVANAPYIKIRNSFEQCRDAFHVTIHNQLKNIFSLTVNPHTYHDEEIQYTNEMYSIRGFERNGKYLLLEEA